MPRKETAMNEMIERVAKAIAKSNGIKNLDDMRLGVPLWQCFDKQALAAIKAMREPTDAMVTAGDTTFADYEGWGPPRETWPRMIDAALSDAA